MIVQGGMTPHEALRSATIDGARYMGMEKDLGSIEAGKLADILVIDGDVLGDIRRSENITHTVINGRVFEATSMKQVWPEEKAPATFWFE
jgi:imidazolonepropionase-like amidohydrolase